MSQSRAAGFSVLPTCIRCSDPRNREVTICSSKLLPNIHLCILQPQASRRAEGGCLEGVGNSFSFLFEAQQQETEKKRVSQQKSCLLHVPPRARWDTGREQPGDKSLLLIPSDGSVALNPGPHTPASSHTQAKVPGPAARECRVLRHSLPHQNGKNISCTGTAGPKEEQGAYFSLLPVLAAERCLSQQLFAWIGK